MDVSLLQYPAKSHRKQISLPTYSNELAEILGIVLGDGGINNDWQLVISLNYIKDQEYALYIKSNCQRIYIYNQQGVIKYLNIFGSSNPRIINKYLEWKNVQKDI